MELSSNNYDFAGWATRSNQLCADGRTIMPDAFKHNDGQIVPLIWNHQHNDPLSVLGKALLHCVDGDVYTYCAFNDTESGNVARELVQHGDVCSLSICANQLKQTPDRNVMHGMIREVSLVVAGANPKARIETVSLAHSDDGNEYEEEIHVYTEESIELYHSGLGDKKKEDKEPMAEKNKEKSSTESKKDKPEEKTLKDVFDSMTEEQQKVCCIMVAQALEEAGVEEDDKENDDNVEHSEGGDDIMKHNVFDQEEIKKDNVLTHADQEAIVALAKQSSVGSLKQAMEIFAENNETLAHGAFQDYSVLFPDYELLKKGEPETLERDQSWISNVMQKIQKSPISRIRTRQADARIAELRAKGYQNKGDEKKKMAQIKVIGRTTDPQTIYIKDDMHRDDIIDITDFDVVGYQWRLMRHVLDEELALAALIGDGRDEGDPDKIHETHIRSIWNDDEMYTIHKDVDVAAARKELQGTNTSANFGENYIYAEAIITAALYAREKYKGSGTPDLYCTPHLVNVMLLARDLNGRRIYSSKADLAAALNVGEIYTIEQFEGRTRIDVSKGTYKKLLGLFVNLADYQFGATKGGEVTRFEDFDMDFNKYKYMLETRLSGSLTKLFSAIALEEPVAAEAEG